MSAITLSTLQTMKQQGEKFTCLTAYDASFATLIEEAGVEVLLVGDSLGMVVQGQQTTLPVTLDDMVYHTAAVQRGTKRSLIMADLPFACDASPEQSYASAARLMAEGGAHIVKLEATAAHLPHVEFLAAHSIPVCAHLGLLPQSVNKYGGYKVQGKDEAGRARLIEEAMSFVSAGADMLLLECVPATLAHEIAKSSPVPVIGIGAGAECDAQVLVSYDMLGLTAGHRPRFSKNFLLGRDSLSEAVAAYVSEVKTGQFPTGEHSF